MSAARDDTVVRELSMESREQGSNSAAIIFLISSVIGLLQAAPFFQTHPTNMWVCVAALLIFCLSQTIKKKINQTRWRGSYSQIIDGFHLLSGALIPVSVLSIFLPNRFWWLFFVIWLLLGFIMVIYSVYRWIYQAVMKAIKLIGRFIKRFRKPQLVLPIQTQHP